MTTSDSHDSHQEYDERIERVLRYVHHHLDEPLSLDRLSEVAHFSKFHFHRQFTACVGMPVQQLVRLLRLQQSSRHVAFTDASITEIALDAGFGNPESFARAFRKTFGQSPSDFRVAPDWRAWRAVIARLPQREISSMQVEIVDFPNTTIALLEHRGPEHEVYATTRRFIEWRRSAGIPPDAADTYGLHYHAYWLYGDWLPASGEELRDFPFFFHYVNIGPDIRDHDMVTDLYLPLR